MIDGCSDYPTNTNNFYPHVSLDPFFVEVDISQRNEKQEYEEILKFHKPL